MPSSYRSQPQCVAYDSLECGYGVAILLGFESVLSYISVHLVAISVCNLVTIVNQSSNLDVVNTVRFLGQETNILDCYGVSPVASSLAGNNLNLGVSYNEQYSIVCNQSAIDTLVSIVSASERSARSSSVAVGNIVIVASQVLGCTGSNQILQLVVAVLIGSVGVQLVLQIMCINRISYISTINLIYDNLLVGTISEVNASLNSPILTQIVFSLLVIRNEQDVLRRSTGGVDVVNVVTNNCSRYLIINRRRSGYRSRLLVPVSINLDLVRRTSLNAGNLARNYSSLGDNRIARGGEVAGNDYSPVVLLNAIIDVSIIELVGLAADGSSRRTNVGYFLNFGRNRLQPDQPCCCVRSIA